MRNTDSETGETELINFLQNSKENRFLDPDQETGEVNLEHTSGNNAKKIKFQVPKSYLRPKSENNANKEREQKCCLLNTKETFTLTRKEKVINLQEEIIIGSNKTSHRMFLIPSLFFFPQISAIIIIISEIVLHTWAHRKNSRTDHTSPYYYRSPLHLLTSQFCAVCRQKSEMQIIWRLHDEQLYFNLKHVTKTIG